MTDIADEIGEAILEVFKPIIQTAISAAQDYAEGEVAEAVEDVLDEPEKWLPKEAYNDLDECIRCFDSDPQTAKFLLSRALKDIPGAPQWLG